MQQPLTKITLTLSDGTARDFFHRGSTGDKGAMQQVFGQQDYNLAPFRMAPRLMAYGERMRGARKSLIIDAGANIGTSALYFSDRYTHSTVIAIEPEKNNFALLKRNCEGRDIVCMEAALGAAPGQLFLSDPGLSDWGFRVGETGDYAVNVVTIPSLLATYSADAYLPLLCKIDIEGGEAALFAKDYGWMDVFPLIIIELHDWMLPGEGNARNFLKAVTQFDFDFVYRGENVFCFNNRLLRDFA